MAHTRRLIETWLPIAAIGEESVRERRSMTALPPTYYLHVWWARRPLVASRAAVMASLLPADADRAKFMHMLGIHGDPVASRRRIDEAKRTGERFDGQAYTYPRAFSHVPSSADRDWFAYETRRVTGSGGRVLDPTAGGGSVPFEAARVGLQTLANDLNPVAAAVLHATVLLPYKLGDMCSTRFRELAARFVSMREERLRDYFPPEPKPNAIATNWIWARTITCPYCDGLIPLSPNWRLAPDGTGIRLVPERSTGRCRFEIVRSGTEESTGTVSSGDARCPFPDCGRVVTVGEIKRLAMDDHMGEQLCAVVFKERVESVTKSGRRTSKWVRGYRPPRPEDDVEQHAAAVLAERLPVWQASDIVPGEELPMCTESWTHGNTPAQYGARNFTDLFSPRQLLTHGTASEVYRELLDSELASGPLDEATRAAFVYLSFSLDKLRDYNSIMTRWHSRREVMVNTFDRHDFASKWTYAEMAPLVEGLGYDWAIEQTAKCIDELVELTHGKPSKAKRGRNAAQIEIFEQPAPTPAPPPITITCRPGDDLSHIASSTVDAVVMDPPYYDNVMYAELSDFFYVWLKRTAGYVMPELFTRRLTDKESEAVANPAKFAGQKGAKALAGRDYQERMARIFAECRRVLKPDGIMTVMFTHKATGAWDALTTGLMEAGFTVTASWPINTEAEGSLHIKDKSAANSTIFLVCRPREETRGEPAWWEDVEPLVADAVKRRIAEYEAAGIRGVDLYLSCFGPALEEFAKHWPLRRGQPLESPASKRRQGELFDDFDPYRVTPEDALLSARREVKRWRMERLTHMKASVELDPLTEWFVLAWDAFSAPTFPYDEALRLARVVGLDLDRDVVGSVAEKKGSDLVLWDSSRRAAKGALGSPDGSGSMLDALHHAAHLGRTRNLQAAAELLARSGADKDAGFPLALGAVLEVLPVSRAYGGVHDDTGAVAEAAGDFGALEGLRRLVFSERVPKPEQLALTGV